MKKMVLVSCFLIWIATNLSAQNHTDASGGNATGSGGSVSYSVGQIDYTTKTGTGGTITEGVQQPYKITIVNTGIDESSINLNAKVFPNPTSDFVELQINDVTHTQLNYEILNLTGKVIEQKAITENMEKINMVSLPNGIYFLKVISSNEIVKTFKIVKTI